MKKKLLQNFIRVAIKKAFLKVSLVATAASFMLTGCGKEAKDNSVLVVIEEGDSFTVEENALRVVPGDDAVFSIDLKHGNIILSTDYRGEYGVTEDDDGTILTLKNVKYPTRVRIQTASKSGRIQYQANGGVSSDGSNEFACSYSLTAHKRANTSIGTDTLSREGYTLTSWNTDSSGNGDRIGLGSRVSLSGGSLTLYAQWAKWSDEADFEYIENDGSAIITGYTGSDTELVIPGMLNSHPVKAIKSCAFKDCSATSVILPSGIKTIESGAFEGCSMTELTLFDDLESFSDNSFKGCDNLKTLYINAIEAPFGYAYRKESCYADKIDMLILAQGKKKMVFYGGCSMWYNLDGIQADRLFGDEYTIINTALNGTVSSAVQMQIMARYLESGDVLFHTPEISSKSQLMIETGMHNDDSSLWCGLENNYDLFALVDMRTVDGVFDSLEHYLSLKDKTTDYNKFYSDDYRTPYTDKYGCIGLYRSEHSKNLTDSVSIKPELLNTDSLVNLLDYYRKYNELGVTIYVSHACVNVDALEEGQEKLIPEANELFKETISSSGYATVISDLSDYIYHSEDFYDTNYHLLSEPAKENTTLWMRDFSNKLK